MVLQEMLLLIFSWMTARHIHRCRDVFAQYAVKRVGESHGFGSQRGPRNGLLEPPRGLLARNHIQKLRLLHARILVKVRPIRPQRLQDGDTMP